MTTRADVNRLRIAVDGAVGLARNDLAEIFAAIVGGDPRLTRDALLEIVPALVREYGDLSAAVAAEWYEEVRAASVGGTYRAQLGGPAASSDIESSVRWAAGELFGDNPEQALVRLSGALNRHISYSSRDTVRRNVAGDPGRPRYARVPSGAKTCAFCSMLASRGFVYHTQTSAGGDWNSFHDDCRCQVVPEWDRDQHHIEGYDPDAMFDKYQTASEAAGSGNTNAILAEMRRLYPDDFTDGVVGT